MPRRAQRQISLPPAVIEGGKLFERGADGVMISPSGEDGPSEARQQHGDFTETKIVRDGKVAKPKRAVDLLDDLCTRKVITPRLRAAGRLFQADFETGQLVGARAVDWQKETRMSRVRLNEDAEDARERVRAALTAMGDGSLLYDVTWRVIGFGESLRSFYGDGAGRTRDRYVGFVMAALIVLETHYVSAKRMEPAKPA